MASATPKVATATLRGSLAQTRAGLLRRVPATVAQVRAPLFRCSSGATKLLVIFGLCGSFFPSNFETATNKRQPASPLPLFLILLYH